MITDKDIDNGAEWLSETMQKWALVGVQAGIKFVNRHRSLIKEAVSDVKTAVDFLDAKL